MWNLIHGVTGVFAYRWKRRINLISIFTSTPRLLDVGEQNESALISEARKCDTDRPPQSAAWSPSLHHGAIYGKYSSLFSLSLSTPGPHLRPPGLLVPAAARVTVSPRGGLRRC